MITILKTFLMSLFVFKKKRKIFFRFLFPQTCDTYKVPHPFAFWLPCLASGRRGKGKLHPSAYSLFLLKPLLLCYPGKVTALNMCFLLHTWAGTEPAFLRLFTNFEYLPFATRPWGCESKEDLFLLWNSPHSFTGLRSFTRSTRS